MSAGESTGWFDTEAIHSAVWIDKMLPSNPIQLDVIIIWSKFRTDRALIQFRFSFFLCGLFYYYYYYLLCLMPSAPVCNDEWTPVVWLWLNEWPNDANEQRILLLLCVCMCDIVIVSELANAYVVAMK